MSIPNEALDAAAMTYWNKRRDRVSNRGWTMTEWDLASKSSREHERNECLAELQAATPFIVRSVLDELGQEIANELVDVRDDDSRCREDYGLQRALKIIENMQQEEV